MNTPVSRPMQKNTAEDASLKTHEIISTEQYLFPLPLYKFRLPKIQLASLEQFFCFIGNSVQENKMKLSRI